MNEEQIVEHARRVPRHVLSPALLESRNNVGKGIETLQVSKKAVLTSTSPPCFETHLSIASSASAIVKDALLVIWRNSVRAALSALWRKAGEITFQTA
ncbi:hypothetical protein Tcan_13820 [Toxocara canis]|uniref:Uncharacterized protein n=1 Tax=Toxocara canis TaxID=6265 RepID=A0A0B2VIV0_TOXCA|nr:hypothetical protein Tcan_13820 [Toxocara canis]